MNEGTKIALRVTLCIVILVSVISLANVQEAQKKNTEFINSLDKICVAWEYEGSEISIHEMYDFKWAAENDFLDSSDDIGNFTVLDFNPTSYDVNRWEVLYKVENSSGRFYDYIHFDECVRHAFVVEGDVE